VLSFTLVFVSYFLGFNNDELDFHICTGRDPNVNVARTLIKMRQPRPVVSFSTSAASASDSASEWMTTDSYGTDPIATYLKITFLIFICLNLQIWLYANMSHFGNIWLSFRSRFNKSNISVTGMPDIYIGNLTKNHNEKFAETKSSILGTTQTVVMIVVGIGALLPVSI
jgi:hypothetical protein